MKTSMTPVASKISYLAILALFTLSAFQPMQCYNIGTGIADITGPVAQVMLMGYATLGQTGQGILQRLWARAFIVAQNDNEDSMYDYYTSNGVNNSASSRSKRIVFVNTDTQSMGDIVKARVVRALQQKYGNSLYTADNVMISSTHSHSGVGGYLQYTLYEFASLGWIEETVGPLVKGITQSIINAHENLQSGSIALTQGELLNTNINRSPQSYLLNPKELRSRYKHDVDKNMTVLSFRDDNDIGLGMVSWFAVHGVSVNNTNRLVNGDNKGYAAYLAEKMMNDNRYRIGDSNKNRFIAAFAQSNEGDVSPNTLGPYCTGTDIPCDGTRDTKCPKGSQCAGRGPGWTISDLESNRIIGQNQAFRALELYNARKAELKVEGPIDYVHLYWNITKSIVVDKDGNPRQICSPAMGYAMAAGTTDGPALNGFYQNATSGTFGWDIIKDMIQKPSEEQKRCHAPKPILLDTGEIKYKHPWQPEILDIQLFRLGNVYIYAVPAEFTTMSGRILREAIKKSLIKQGLGNDDTVVIHSGPANGYASYCATFEEYQHQRFEGASTAYGPYTLQAYVNAFDNLVFMMANPDSHNYTSETLPDYTDKGFNFAPPYRSDQPPFLKSFGDVIKDVSSTYYSKNLLSFPYAISATFVAGNPRNDPMLEGTFLTVEKRLGADQWEVIRTDNDYDTRFIWKYKYQLFGISEATIEWHITSDIEPGIYRLGYKGASRASFKEEMVQHQGYSSEFEISDLY